MTVTDGYSLRRAFILLGVAGLWIFVLFGRLFYLQVVRRDDFRALLLTQLERHQQLQMAQEVRRQRLGMRSAQTLLVELNAKLSRIESLPISELRALLQDASDLIAVSTAERQTLELENSQLEAALHSKKDIIDTYNRELTRLQGLTSEERRMIQTLLGDVVQREGQTSFLWGAFLSFPIGMAASLLAGITHARLFGRAGRA